MDRKTVKTVTLITNLSNRNASSCSITYQQCNHKLEKNQQYLVRSTNLNEIVGDTQISIQTMEFQYQQHQIII